MILDIIFVVLLLVILGLLLFFLRKTFASMKEQLAKLIQNGHQYSDSMKQELAELIQDGHQYSDSMKQELAKLIQERTPDPLPPVINDFNRIRDEFRKYVQRESTILRDDGGNAPFVRYKTGIPNPNKNGLPPIWINAWIPDDDGIISAGISVTRNSPFLASHYQELKENKSKIEAAFSFDTTIEIAELANGIRQFRVNKAGVDLTQTTNWDTEFRWLRENLEKLYWVLQIQDTGPGWDAL